MSDNWYSSLMDTLRKTEEEIKLGGGTARIEKEHKKGKMTARERVDFCWMKIRRLMKLVFGLLTRCMKRREAVRQPVWLPVLDLLRDAAA